MLVALWAVGEEQREARRRIVAALAHRGKQTSAQRWREMEEVLDRDSWKRSGRGRSFHAARD